MWHRQGRVTRWLALPHLLCASKEGPSVNVQSLPACAPHPGLPCRMTASDLVSEEGSDHWLLLRLFFMHSWFRLQDEEGVLGQSHKVIPVFQEVKGMGNWGSALLAPIMPSVVSVLCLLLICNFLLGIADMLVFGWKWVNKWEVCFLQSFCPLVGSRTLIFVSLSNSPSFSCWTAGLGSFS